MSLAVLVKSFLQGIGVIALAALLYEYVLYRFRSETVRNIAVGAILASAAVASMSTPFEIREGVIFDLRHMFLVLAATLGGPAAAIIAMVSTALFRFYLGGIGVNAGLLGIVLSSCAGIGLAQLFRASDLSIRVLLIYGLAASLSLLSLFILPLEIVFAVLDGRLIPVVIANVVGVVIAGQMLRHKKLGVSRQKQLSREASVDILTGMMNRRAFETRAPELLRQSHSIGLPCSAMLIDIDHFKAVNDTFGHASGDEVLRAVAKIIMATIKQPAIAARIGGEEFAVVMPYSDMAAATLLAGELRHHIEAEQHIFRGISLRVTASIGVHAIIDPDETIGEALHLADKALYDAKRSGRNQVKLSLAA